MSSLYFLFCSCQFWTFGFGIETITSPQIIMYKFSRGLKASTIVFPWQVLVREMTLTTGSMGTFRIYYNLLVKIEPSSLVLLHLGIERIQFINSRSESLFWMAMSNSTFIWSDSVKKTSTVSLINFILFYNFSPGLIDCHSWGQKFIAII